MPASRVFEHNGEKVTFPLLAKRHRVTADVLRNRYDRGDRGDTLVRPIDTNRFRSFAHRSRGLT